MSKPKSWKVRLTTAWQAVTDAELERERVTRAALDAGLSARTIGALLGVSHSTVWRTGGGKGDDATQAELLDRPAVP